MIFPPITPISIVRVMRGVPLDNTYQDVLTFSSESQRDSLMMGFTKYIYTDLTPVKMENAIRLPAAADYYYDCNYIMFQNANFTNRWFYAFITRIDYENINTCLLHFELDVWTTWYFEILIHPSFVSREHINDDAIGNNLVPEDVEMGEYVVNNYSNTNYSSDSYIVVVSSVDMNGEPVTGNIYSGIYSGLTYLAFDDISLLNQMIERLTTQNKRDAIISIFMMPKAFFSTTPAPSIQTVNIDKQYTSIDGYVPKNNKLFTHPYNTLMVTNYEGTAANFPYEYFKNPDICMFTLVGDTSPNPSIMLRPSGYKINTGILNANEKITLTGFPQCAFTTDTFKAWLAQNAASLAISNIGGVMSTLLQPTPGKVVDNLFTNVAQSINQVYIHSTLPPQAHGQQSGGVDFVSALKEFGFYSMSIRAEFAQIIDNYFEMFGYATNRLKVPNYVGRPYWNYVKTIGAKITGSVPFNDITRIRQMFNDGVTFWHDTNVGNYDRTNK